MYIFLLTLLGLSLRLINLDKPEGLWNDEYVSWFVASTPFNQGFWQEIFKQCHMPFYYLYLKPFTGCNDIILRLTSILPSVIAIPVMFLVGKEFSKKTGYICAGITSVLPFLVYYSQEVRFYSLVFLFSAFSLLYLIKLTKGENGWLGFILSSSIILFTHVLGGIYVTLTIGYLAYKKKRIPSKIAFGLLISAILILPFGSNILKMLPSSQWWGEFSYTNILFLFSDYLSPILTNHINAPNIFFYSKNLLFTILILVPTILGLTCFIKGVKYAKGLTVIALGVVLITATLSISGKLVFITKYTIEILPILILIIGLGIKGRIGAVLLSTFIAFQLFAIFTPFYPAKTFRSEGHKLVGEIINSTKQDYIIFTYYEPNRFTRYLNTDAKMSHISKINRFEFIDTPEKILKDIHKGERVSVVFLDSVSFIPENWIENAKQRNLPEMFITFSIIRNALTKELNSQYTDFEVKKDGSWTVISATKLK